jgi:hypothetical protein
MGDYQQLSAPTIDGAPEIVRLPKKVKPEDITIDDLRHLSDESFALWTQTSGVTVDGNPIDFNSHRYLLPIYMCNDTEVVWQKAAQLGATVFMLLRLIHWLHTHQGRKAGLYFPTKEGVENLSKDRLTPLLQSIPELNGAIDPQDKLGLRKIGKSSLYLFHLGGVASKDSVPLDFVAFDEVRLCKAQDIDQALERISHSVYREKIFMSTAGMPSGDIAARFDLGTQHIFMAKCGCPDGVDLARTFPACVVDDKKRGKLYLRCPKCNYVINDPQNGRYVAHNPGASYTSFHVSQLTSKYMPLRTLWDFYQRTTNKSEFYNAKLGLPYIDEENQGVSISQLKACVDPTLEWASPGKIKGTAMGVDVGGGYCYVVIADLHESKKRVRHVEIIETDNPNYMENGKRVSPFKRLRVLMKEYGVQLCVIDAMPNYDSVIEFAQEFPGKVFASFYAKEAKDVVTWSDRPRTKISIKKAGPLLKFKYYCVLSRYLSLDVALSQWAGTNVICPDPDKLVQMCMDERTKELQPEAIMNRAFSMLTRLVKRFDVSNEETGEGRHTFIYSGGDPHFAHAWNYCNVALERLRRGVIFAFG